MRMRNPKDKEFVLSNCDFYYDENNEYKNGKNLHIEIGMGKGNFVIGMAKANPDINYIGIEKYSAVASLAIKKIEQEKLGNVKVIVMDIVDTISLLEKKVDKIYLNFSDPWPKDRHAKRRLTHENQLKVYDKLFKAAKEIEMKTDNDDLFAYSLESLKNYGYEIVELYYDLHKENKFNVMTEYEEKFSNKGVKIKYLLAYKK